MKLRRCHWWKQLMPALLSIAIGSCNGIDKPNLEASQKYDSDSGPDADSDGDADSDTNGNPDGDTDGDTDTDGDMEIDIDGDADIDPKDEENENDCVATHYEAEAIYQSTGTDEAGGWNLWTDGYVSVEHAFANETTITVTAKGSFAGGSWPHMNVVIDDMTIGNTTVVSDTWKDYPFQLKAIGKTSVVRVEFDNDYKNDIEDRNLYLDKISIGCDRSADGNTSPVGRHGRLHVDGSRLLDKNNNPVQLKGMSLFWHNWMGQFYNRSVVKTLADEWGSSIVRAVIGIEPNGAYLTDPADGLAKSRTVIDAAIAHGIYVLVDWHAHDIHTADAKNFFVQIASEYGQHPNVIYEIFNEPDAESWGEVKTYASEVIGAIRKVDPDNVIIVGSPNWDQDVNLPAGNPITGYKNIAYSLHFYSGSHTKWLRIGPKTHWTGASVCLSPSGGFHKPTAVRTARFT